MLGRQFHDPPEGGEYVFVSYARVDAKAADWLENTLLDLGVISWRDTVDIGAGSWRAELDRAVTGARAIFVLVSPASMASIEVGREIYAAADQRKTIVPLLLEPCHYPDGVRNALAGLQAISLVGSELSEAAPRIARVLSQIGFDLKNGSYSGPVSAAFHQRVVRPEYSDDLVGGLHNSLALAQEAYMLAPTNVYTQLSLAILLLHCGAVENGLDHCRAVAKREPTNPDALHFLSVAELCWCAPRRMTLFQIEEIERRSVQAYSLSSQRGGHFLLPLGAVTSDYRMRFGGLARYGRPPQIAAQIMQSVGSESEMRRFFSLVRTSFDFNS